MRALFFIPKINDFFIKNLFVVQRMYFIWCVNSLNFSFINFAFVLKVNKSWYIALFVVSGSIKKLFSSDCVVIFFSQSIVFANIYLFSIFLNRFCTRCESVVTSHCLYCVSLTLGDTVLARFNICFIFILCDIHGIFRMNKRYWGISNCIKY